MRASNFKYIFFIGLILTCFMSLSMLEIKLPSDKNELIQETDSLTKIWDKHIAEVIEQLKGKEDLPADSVFENVKNENFKKLPARRLMAIMKFGYSRSLGVGCGHCHNTKDWASDEKVAKQITREMSSMVNTINSKLLTSIEGLKGREQLFVNCTTCHRGDIKPALNME